MFLSEYLSLVLESTTIVDSPASAPDWFAKRTFREGDTCYFPAGEKKTWKLGIITSVFSRDSVIVDGDEGVSHSIWRGNCKDELKVNTTADTLFLLDALTPWREKTPDHIVSAPVLVVFTDHTSLEKYFSYKNCKQWLLWGTDDVFTIFNLLGLIEVGTDSSVFEISGTVKRQHEILYGRIYAIMCLAEYADDQRVVGWYNLCYQPEFLTETPAPGSMVVKIKQKIADSDFGIFKSWDDLSQAFNYYFPVPTYISNADEHLFKTFPDFGGKNHGDVTKAFFDRKMGWLYQAELIIDADLAYSEYAITVPTYIPQYYLIHATSSLESSEITRWRTGLNVSIITREDTYYSAIDENGSFVTLSGTTVEDTALVPKSFLLTHNYIADFSTPGMIIDPQTGFRLFDKLIDPGEPDDFFTVFNIRPSTGGETDNQVHIFRGSARTTVFLYQDLHKVKLVKKTDAKPRFKHGDVVNCLYNRPFTQGIVVAIKSNSVQLSGGGGPKCLLITRYSTMISVTKT